MCYLPLLSSSSSILEIQHKKHFKKTSLIACFFGSLFKVFPMFSKRKMRCRLTSLTFHSCKRFIHFFLIQSTSTFNIITVQLLSFHQNSSKFRNFCSKTKCQTHFCRVKRQIFRRSNIVPSYLHIYFSKCCALLLFFL